MGEWALRASQNINLATDAFVLLTPNQSILVRGPREPTNVALSALLSSSLPAWNILTS